VHKMKQLLASLLQIGDNLNLSVYLVGGAVRDSLLGEEVNDFDFLVSDSVRDLAVAFAKEIDGRMFTLDEERKIYRVVGRGDLASCRFDFAYSPQSSLKSNLAKRDFTINAMALPLADSLLSDWKAKIIDPLGGRKDLDNRVLRAVSDSVFNDDPLRLIRAARFALKYGLKISKETLELVDCLEGIDVRRVAPERVRDEFMQILSLPNSYRVVVCLDRELRCLDLFFPEIKGMKGVEQGPYHNFDVWEHCLETLRHFENNVQNLGLDFSQCCQGLRDYINSQSVGGYSLLPLLKFVCLFHDLGKPRVMKRERGRVSFIGHEVAGGRAIADLGERLRFSRKEIKLLSLFVSSHMRPLGLAKAGGVTKKAVHRFYRDLGDNGLGVLLISLADKQSTGGPLTTESFLNCFRSMVEQMMVLYLTRREEILPPPLLTSVDLKKEIGISPGPIYRQILRELGERQVTCQIKERQEALEWVAKYMKKTKRFEKSWDA
jgi:poly(A) polymerase